MSHPYQPLPPLTFPPPRPLRRCLPGVSGDGRGGLDAPTSFVRDEEGPGARNPPGPAAATAGPRRAGAASSGLHGAWTRGPPRLWGEEERGGGGRKQAALPTATAPAVGAACRDFSPQPLPRPVREGGAALRGVPAPPPPPARPPPPRLIPRPTGPGPPPSPRRGTGRRGGGGRRRCHSPAGPADTKRPL